jgi:hypothetical protein
MDYLKIFIALTSAAVVVEAGMLIAMYLAIRQSALRLETLAGDVCNKLMPIVDLALSMVTELRPNLKSCVSNASRSSTLVRHQVEQLSMTIGELNRRVRLQIIRGDELISRSFDRVEQTNNLVHKTVIVPVHRVSAIFHGVFAGMQFLLSAKNSPSLHCGGHRPSE